MKQIEYILTGEEMQLYDKNTIEQLGVPSIVLMEQAALAAFHEMKERDFLPGKKILILSGNGNNGGDSLALARLLSNQDAKVTVFFVNNEFLEEKRFTQDTRIQYQILCKMNIPIVTKLPSDSYDMIIDGIFGVGLNRDIKGQIYETIAAVNKYKGTKIALDIPSGVHSETGKILNIGFQADLTLTFSFYKRGHFFFPGRSYCGEIIKKEIGITEKSFLGKIPGMYSLGGKVLDHLPIRKEDGHKGTFGKILVVAGSREVGGAALLSAKAAFLSGCGMVRLCIHQRQYESVFFHLPEAIYDCYETGEEAVTALQKGLSWADTIIMGPGMGTDDTAKALWKEVILCSRQTLILDADALNLLAVEEFEKVLSKRQNREDTRRSLILTPHPLEFSRLCKKPLKDLKNDWETPLKEYAAKMNAIVVKKDAPTVICDFQKRLVLNRSGNHAMATAGSGDVLCGIIGAFVSYTQDVFTSVCAAVYCHGRAGEIASFEKGCYSVIAGNLLEFLPEVLKEK